MNALKGWALSNSAVGTVLRDERVILAVFTATIFLSASLLFSVQPMFAKMVLPKLGGSPSVWAVSMCFFQAALLCGYGYAHLINRTLTPALAFTTHMAFLALACFALPIALPAFASDPPPGDAYFWLVGVLCVGVGLPFFAVSANAPLLQSWFGLTGHSHAADPYFLYGASNLGSLLALLSYPVLIEPTVGLLHQGVLWAFGFVLLGAMIALCGFVVAVNAPMVMERTEVFAGARDGVASGDEAGAVMWSDRLIWIGLAFGPSALLVAFTTFLTSDIASAPFLWVIPLAVFLGTFSATFRNEPIISHARLLKVQPIVVGFAFLSLSWHTGGWMWLFGLVATSLAFLVATLICHRELYLRRPSAVHLTEFYLWMSFGGVLGGIFAALVAPQIFSSVYEWPVLLILCLILRPQILDRSAEAGEWRRAALIVACGIGFVAFVNLLIAVDVIDATAKLRLYVVLPFVLLMFLPSMIARLQVAVAVVMFAALAYLPEASGTNVSVRSFFGVHRVFDLTGGQMRVLMHGTTMHGAERQYDGAGRRIADPKPVSYYYQNSPMRRSVDVARAAAGGNIGALRIGVVGLGAGSMACFKERNEDWRFYEIDQAVVDIARDAKLFRFLSRCQPEADIVVGDARLTVAKEKDQSFDYLLIDAFSSDAIPVHLLTVEALSMFMSKIKDRGVLALHLSNRHMDLPSAVAATLDKIAGLSAVVVRDTPDKKFKDASPSEVMLISRHPEVISEARRWTGARAPDDRGARPWTDDYSDIVSSLLRHWFW